MARERRAWLMVLWGVCKLVGGVAVLFGAIHLIEASRQGALPPVYNVVFLGVGFVCVMLGLYTGLRDCNRGLQELKTSREPSETTPVRPPWSLRMDDQLELAVLEPSDEAAFFELVDDNREFLSRWLSSAELVTTREEAADRLVALYNAFCHELTIPAGIWLDGELAGMVGLGPIDQRRRSGQLFYWIGEAYQGKGLVTRSCTKMLNHAFGELRLRRVLIRCEPRNKRSCAVAERLGFTLEGTLRECERRGEELIDLHMYGMLRREWKETEADGEIDGGGRV